MMSSRVYYRRFHHWLSTCRRSVDRDHSGFLFYWLVRHEVSLCDICSKRFGVLKDSARMILLDLINVHRWYAIIGIVQFSCGLGTDSYWFLFLVISSLSSSNCLYFYVIQPFNWRDGAKPQQANLVQDKLKDKFGDKFNEKKKKESSITRSQSNFYKFL